MVRLSALLLISFQSYNGRHGPPAGKILISFPLPSWKEINNEKPAAAPQEGWPAQTYASQSVLLKQGASLCSAFVHGSEQIDFLSLWPLYACRTLMPMTPAGWRRCHCFQLNAFNIATLINALERRQSIAPVFPIQK